MHKFDLTKAKITDAVGGTAFLVQVTPDAAEDEITKKDSDVVYVNLTAPAKLESLNKKLADFLGEKLELDPEKVTIASGNSLEKKIVIVMGLTPEEIERRLGV